MDLQKLLTERSQAKARLDEIVAGAEAENRELNEAEQKEYNDKLAEVKSLSNRIDRARELGEMQNQHDSDTQALNAPQDPPHQPVPHDNLKRGYSDKEKKDLSNYSFRSAFLASRQQGRLEGLELEMHVHGEQEYAMSGCSPGDGVIIPKAVLWHGSRREAGQQSRYRNDMTSGSGLGGETIATETRAPIDVFYDALVLEALGATILAGLEGNVTFPKFGAASLPTEKAENAAADELSATTSSATMTPNRLPFITEISTQLLRQSSTAVENWLRNHMLRNMAARMQVGAINGSGASNQPTGILNAAGLPLVALGTDGAAPDRTTLTRLKGTVSIANAAEGSLGFLTNGKIETTLNETKTDAGSGMFVWPTDQPNRLAGAPAGVTNAVPSNLVKGSSGAVCSAIVYGNWADLIVGQWGGITLLTDPYSKMDTGLLRIGGETFYDVLTSRTASFAAVKDALTVI